MDARVKKATEIIARKIDKPPSVKDLADQLRLSQSRLQHLFKENTGRALKQFIRATRMANANDLLRDPTRRVKEVAAAVGYPDSSSFSHDFRKHYGKSASELRSSLFLAEFDNK